MKKALAILAVFAIIPTVSFAAYTTGSKDIGGGTVNGAASDTLTLATSNSVFIDYADGNTGETFVISTYHARGDRTYMSSSEDANIYWGSGTKVTMPGAPTRGTSVGETADFDHSL